MQIKNNYNKMIFNGDIGIIKTINKIYHQVEIQFGDKLVSYDFSELNEITLSYATSIHKSQGSEFAAVIIPMFMQHFILLQRNLLYTAITRAKKMCILIGEAKAIAIAIKNNKIDSRKTFLSKFIQNDSSLKISIAPQVKKSQAHHLPN